MGENLTSYFQQATGERSVRAIAQAIGIEQTTLNRQITGKSALPVETAVLIARAYDIDMADVFTRAGFITEEEAQRLGARVGLAAYTDLELAREIVRRIEAGEAGEALTGELPVDVPTSVDDLEVREPRTLYGLAADKGQMAVDQPHAD